MAYIPLVEYTRPRIMMLDFSPQDVAKVQKAGFDARRGATGLHDRDKFCFPFAVPDVEIMFAQVTNGSFIYEKERVASSDSLEASPFFKDLLREIWHKAGWSILFISQNTSPEELKSIGLESLGVISHDHHHTPESLRKPLLEIFEEINDRTRQRQVSPLPPPRIPHFVGLSIRTSDEPEAAILQRYIKSARMSILACLEHPLIGHLPSNYDPQPHVAILGTAESFEWLILDNSVDQNVLALKIKKIIHVGIENNRNIYNRGGILLLPDFGENNGNVTLALLQEVITGVSPHLFDTPQHSWLEKYQPATVLHLLDKRQVIIEEALKKIEQLDTEVETEKEKYGWLSSLLVSTGDEFMVDVAQALRFLGFDVEEVDNSLAPGERKREDLRIRDTTTEYFALVEAKTTGKGRGTAEEFVTKTQNHQARYARENQQPPPPALLIVNFATDIDPVQRTGRFYQMEVAERLEDNGITAINSVALFDLCQSVLNRQLSKEQVRRFVTGGQPLIAAVTIEEVVAMSEFPQIP